MSPGTIREMQKTVLGKTGLQVSSLGFGAAPVGYLDTESDTVAEVLNALLDAGVNLIDTCACYPHSEELISEAVGHRRAEYNPGQQMRAPGRGPHGAGMVTGIADPNRRTLAEAASH